MVELTDSQIDQEIGEIVRHWVSTFYVLLIAEKMPDTRNTKSPSKQLLEIAKIGLDKAIETDEATATNWLNEQLEALSID